MPANKYALIRYRIIDRCLRNTARPYPTREELRNACSEALYGTGSPSISQSTIDKDIWAMKNEDELGYHAPIEFSRVHKGYFYTDPDYTITQSNLTAEETEALSFATAILYQFRDVPLMANYENALQKIIDRVNLSALEPPVSPSFQIIQFESQQAYAGNEHLTTLYKAIQNQHTVQLNYRKFSDTTVRQHEVYPYLLKEYDNRWYLIAHDTEKNSMVTFGLERITQLEVLNRRFRRSDDFDSEAYFRHSIGITVTSSPPQTIVFSIDSTQGQYLLTRPVHHSQKLLKRKGAEMTFSLHVQITWELISFILSHGPHIRITQPVALSNKVAGILRKTRELYC